MSRSPNFELERFVPAPRQELSGARERLISIPREGVEENARVEVGSRASGPAGLSGDADVMDRRSRR
jgi:hypothetical protein